MSLLVKRKQIDSPATEEPRPKRKKVLPSNLYDEIDPDLEKALRLSKMALERSAAIPRGGQPLMCGRFQGELTPEHQKVHGLILEHFLKAKIPQVTEFELRRMCLPKDPVTHIPKDLRIVDVPKLGKGVFLSSKAKPIKPRDTLSAYEGRVQLIYQNQAEAISSYKWALFDYDLEVERGACPARALKGWSEIVDGKERLRFTALINACHPDYPEEANVEPRLILLRGSDQSMSVQMLYTASRKILPGEQLLINYDWPFFDNLKISPLRITPFTHTLNDQDLLTSQECMEDHSAPSSSSSSRSSSTLRRDDDDYKELPSSFFPEPAPPVLPALPCPIGSGVSPVPALASQPRFPLQPCSAPPLSSISGLTLEEIDRRIEKLRAFLLTLHLVCDEEIEKLRTALQTLDFPENLFNTFYEEIKRVLFTSSSKSERDVAVDLRDKLHYFIKILWGKEGSADSCVHLLHSREAPLWWINPHSHFVKIFTKRERCHHPAVQYA